MSTTDMKYQRKADYDIDPIYLDRWSPRSFLEKEVPEEVLMSLFEAARWAPSAMNMQPWRFIVARNQEDRDKFHSFIMEGNLKWCKTAPVLTVIISDKQDGSHAFDAGAAWGFLALEAARKGLITHPMGGFHKDKAREVLNIPDEYDIQALLAIGYQGDKSTLPADLQDREQPSDRRPIKESIFEGSFTHS
ncbi:nitroreductase family protein [Salinibacillus aidingensis]|uniref:Nitroreductase family protein n=1 Tax=Salinibacillus aidingensis TaxID=237684 RepID=A0ABN1BA42_9BACI